MNADQKSPAAALAGGGTAYTSAAAGPGLMVMPTPMMLVKPVAVTLKVMASATVYDKSANVATPATAFTMSVPFKVFEPDTNVIVTTSVALVTGLPNESWISTKSEVQVAPAVSLPGGDKNASWLAPAAVISNALLVACERPGAEATSV